MFSEIQNYFFVSEFQSGGLAHDHGLLWVQNVHQFDISSNESIEKIVDKYSTTNQYFWDPYFATAYCTYYLTKVNKFVTQEV